MCLWLGMEFRGTQQACQGNEDSASPLPVQGAQGLEGISSLGGAGS